MQCHLPAICTLKTWVVAFSVSNTCHFSVVPLLIVAESGSTEDWTTIIKDVEGSKKFPSLAGVSTISYSGFASETK